jgi:hypothetical protein
MPALDADVVTLCCKPLRDMPGVLPGQRSFPEGVEGQILREISSMGSARDGKYCDGSHPDKITGLAREQEFRIVGSPYHETGNALKLDGDYLTLPPRALQSVIVGCLGDYEAVSRIVAEYAPRLPVKRAVRTPSHYSLPIEESRSTTTQGVRRAAAASPETE